MTVFLFAPLREDQEWHPAADIYRTSTGWILKFDLAGVRLEDVEVRLSIRTVSIHGIRRDWSVEDAGCHQYSMEISYSRFHRTIELPTDLSAANFRLDYRDGILLIRITIQEESNHE